MSVKSPQARQALQDYADLGGRVFASHYHVYWFERGTPAFQSIATFVHHNGLPMMYNATIDTSFAKGNLLADWLRSVDGSQTRGILPLSQNAARTTIDAAAPGKSQRWVYAADRSPQVVLYLSASTPVGEANACGRVVVSDLHVSSGGVGSDMPNTPFPAGCVTTILSPQEKVLAFMLFDIGACVTPGAP
jgi:hypothetical protein